MRIHFFKILLVGLLLMNLAGYSQSRRFSHLTSVNGISQSEVYSFLQDSKGFVWIGTVDGLNRYDGYNITVFNTNRLNPHSLSNNTIRSLVEDDLGRIWIGTDNGLNMYDHQTELIYQISINSIENMKLSIWSLLIHNGQLFAGTTDGLWTVDVQSSDLKRIENGFRKINNIKTTQAVRSITKCKKGGIWVAISNHISRIEVQSQNEEAILIEDFSFDGFPVSVVEDFTGNIWIASREGLLRYNPETKQSKIFTAFGTRYGPASADLSSLAIDKNGNLWIGTIDKGLNFIEAGELHKETMNLEAIQYKPSIPGGLNSNLIISLYISNSNHLWIGTIGSGVNIYNPEQKKFSHYRFPEFDGDISNSNFIRSVYVDSQDKIWTGTHNNGLFVFDPNNKNFKKLGFGTSSVFNIAPYKENKLLICSFGIHLVELANNSLKIISSLDDGLLSSTTFFIVSSKPDVYWIATLNGLVRAEIINNQIIADKNYTQETNPGISFNNCRVLLYDDIENKLFVGTEGGGLNIVSLDQDHYPNKIEVYKNQKDSCSLSNNFVRSIVKDKNQNIWVGTYEGLNKLIRDKNAGEISFESYTLEDGLPNNMIQSIVEDDYNSLWIGTNRGLSQFFPAEEKFINYTASDGIQSNEFSEHCVYKKPGGEIYMGGLNGISSFHPEQIEISEQEPKITITEFYLMNKKIKANKKVRKEARLSKSIVLTDSIVLLPDQNNIGFDFSAMIFPSAEKVQYAYMLEGFDEDWQYIDAKDRNANYTNLRHGDYTFMVKATNNDGIWHDVPRKIFIRINTPYFLTWFAFVIYGLIILFAAIYLSYFSVIRYTTKKRLLLEQEHNQSKHELHNMRTKFFINVSHDLRTPLTLIRGPLDSLLKDNNRKNDDQEKLQLIKRNVKRLNYLIEQLLDVRKAESAKLSTKLVKEDIVSFTKEEVAHFSFAINQKGLSLNVPSSSDQILACFDRTMISKALFNIISNAIKYTDIGKIDINIEKVDKDNYEILKNTMCDSYVKVEIQDTGKGIPKEQNEKIFERFYQSNSQSGNGYGIGLSHAKELIDAHHGYIEAESKEESGTTIRFFLPDIEISEETKNIDLRTTEDMYVDPESLQSINDAPVKESAKTILIVEDNSDMRSFIRSELKNEYNVIEAGDGLEGLKEAKEQIPDVIVCDLMMPNMDGIELCKIVKSNIETSHIPFILLTAKVDTETKYDGIKTGADDYIPKPFEMEYLLIRIKNLLESREQLRKLFQKNKVLEPSAVTVTPIDEKFLSTLVKQLEEGIPDSDFSVSSLESNMGMSHANFYRKVKSLTGQSGQELLMSMRLKRAHQIMSEHTGIRIAEIAYMVGFNNPNHFSKCFKKMYGIAPSDFK